MTIPKQKIIPDPEPPLSVSRMVEDIIGCKWSLTVLNLIRQGVHRPGAMRRGVEGLTTKVLNERLRKLTRFGIVERRVFPEVPPHVEYTLTTFGHKFSEVLESIERLEAEQGRMKNEESR
ncbi:MAG: helix-turn-helix transcriptional regulator [Acidobacteria bacterium]|nr:helix-turn-helix transcriptional regulator [Acidobacteriota bacterium]